MKINYIVDDKGNLIPTNQLTKHEAKGWAGAIAKTVKDFGSTGKQFLKDCDQTASQLTHEIGGAPKRKK